MLWRGINKRLGASDTQDGMSPDSLNSGHFEGQVGLLGPRPGVTFFNATAYASASMGLIPFILPGARSILVGSTDGAITVVDAPLPLQSSATYAQGVNFQAVALPELSVTYPATTDEEQATFAGSQTFATALNNRAVLFPMPKIDSSSGGTRFAATVSFQLGIIIAGVNTYGLGGLTLYGPVTPGAFSIQSLAGAQKTYLVLYKNSAATYTGVCVKMTVTWSAGSGSPVVTSEAIPHVLIRNGA